MSNGTSDTWARETIGRRLSHIARVAKTKLSFCLICQLWRRWRRRGDTGAISFLSRTTTGADITDTPMTSDRRICQFLSLTRRFILSFFFAPLHTSGGVRVYTPAKYPTNVSAHIIRMCSTVLKSRRCQWLANITSAYCLHPSISFSSPSRDTATSLATPPPSLSNATYTLPGFLRSHPPASYPSHISYHDHLFHLCASINESLKPY